MRLFIALTFPAQQDMLWKIIEDAREDHIQGNFTRYQNLHLTLAFIGNYDNWQEAAGILEQLDFEGFSEQIEGIGHFRDLYFVSLAPNPLLDAYVDALKSELAKKEIPYDKKPFKPHITLIRKARIPQGVCFQAAPAVLDGSEVVLFESRVVDGKLTYIPLYTKKSAQ